jgi:Ca-activated chloride channel family protein
MIPGLIGTGPRGFAPWVLILLVAALAWCGSAASYAATGPTKDEAAAARAALALLTQTPIPRRVVAISYQAGQAPSLCSVLPTASTGTFELVVGWNPTNPAFATQAKSVLQATIGARSAAHDRFSVTSYGGQGGRPEPTALKALLVRTATATDSARCVALQNGDLRIVSPGPGAATIEGPAARASIVQLAAPWFLLLLVAVPVCGVVYELLSRRRSRGAAAWSTKAMLPNILIRPTRRFRRLPRLLFLLGLAALLVGLARPQRVVGSTTQNSPTVVLAFDTSGSMAARDAKPSRLGEARALAASFLNHLPRRYRVGIVSFANSVHLAIAPTRNRAAAIAAIPSAVTERGGTALGDGVSYAVALASGAGGATSPETIRGTGAVLLFSDGVQTSSGTTPAQAEISAVVDGVPVDTVAIGTAKGSVTQLETVAGVRAPATLPVPAQPRTMRQLAAQTSGIAFTASSIRSPADRQRVYESFHAFTTSSRRTENLGWIAAGIALAFMLAGAAVSGLEVGRLV